MNKKAFTLVELIVVITILAVLATVAFISFQGYALSARDATRLADMNNIEKILSLYNVKHGKYPNPDNKTNITYSGATAWTQGVFGISSYSDGSSMSNIPVDPVTGLEYPYSITSSRQEYQLAAILENPVSSNLTQNTFAGTQEAHIHVKGNYNGKFLKVRKDATTYILGIPSILASDISDVTLESILPNQKLVYKGYKNLPASYSGSVYNTNPTNGFPFGADPYVVDRVVLFEGEISELENSLTARTQFFEDLQTSYSGTTISTESDIAYLLEIDSSSSGEASNYVATSFNNSLKTSIAIVAVSSGGESIPSDWRTQDLNCDKADIVLGTQIWAACNSTLGTGGLEYGDGSACYDYLGGNTTGCNRASNEKENIWNPTYGIDNIWGKLYRYNSLDTNNDDVIDSNDTNFVCGTGYHVPSLVEWTTLTDYLTSNNGDNKIGWLGHTTKDDTNNLVQALQLPLPGSIYPDFFNPEVLIFSNRGSTIRLWTADSNNSSVSKMIYTHSAYDGFFFSTNGQDTAYSIRCIKD